MGNNASMKQPSFNDYVTVYNPDTNDFDLSYATGKTLFFTGINMGEYVGEYSYGQMHGKGVRTWKCGDTFNGYYEDNNPVSGIFINKDGKMSIGTFKKGHILEGSHCDIIIPNEYTYTGSVVDDKPNGYGVMFWKSKSSLNVRFEGTWVCGEMKEGILRKRTPENTFIDFSMPGDVLIQARTY